MNLISMVNYIGPTISFMILDKVWWVEKLNEGRETGSNKMYLHVR